MQLIPKVFHWVWLGTRPLQACNVQWMVSWLIKNPDWSGILWTDSMATLLKSTSEDLVQILTGIPDRRFQIREFDPLVNRTYYDTLGKWVGGDAVLAARSDLVRYEIVARHGGFYLDTDVEAFKPVGDLLDSVRLFYCDEWGPCQGNYGFGAVPNHPAFWTLVRELGPHLSAHTDKLSALHATGPNYFGPRMRNHLDCVIYPYTLFNPLHARGDGDQVVAWPEASIGNHHYQGTWYAQTKVTPPAEFLRTSS